MIGHESIERMDTAMFGAKAFRRTLVAMCAIASISVFVSAYGENALGAGGKPQWTVTAVSRPTNFIPGDETGEDSYQIAVTNTGGIASDGEPVTVTDELPLGLALASKPLSGKDQLSGQKLNCLFRTCTYTGVVVADDTIVLTVPVDVATASPTSVVNVVRVQGGGAPDASVSTPTVISSTPAAFGVSPGGASTVLSTTQAGAHPDLTTSIAFNTVNSLGALAGDPKETIDDLPVGFAGDLVDTPTCPVGVFALGNCPIATQIGVTTLTLDEFGSNKLTLTDPVYNLSPSPGKLAKIGFFAATGVPIEGEVSLRPGDYGLETTFTNTNESLVEIDNVSLSVWGVPADPVHDPLRWLPPTGSATVGEYGVGSTDAATAPFLTNPTVCGGTGLDATFSVTSWEQPSQTEAPPRTFMPFGPIVGCDRLGMKPSLVTEATTTKAYAPTGLNFAMTIPQTYENAHGLATSTLKKAVVTLPLGMTVNPSAGAGLEACTPEQYAAESTRPGTGLGCPNEAKLGLVKIESPAIKEALTGSVFLAMPFDNPFGSLLAIYVIARVPERGIVIKAAGEVSADAKTGRLLVTFDGLPPLPFSHLTLTFSQGDTSPLVTPPSCGEYAVRAQLVPWSDPTRALEPEIPAFPIATAFNGGPCPGTGAPLFSPRVFAGTLNNEAGSYSPMDIRVVRDDGEQEITGFSARLPEGLSADLSGVPFCPEEDIVLAKNATGAQEETHPSCPLGSRIGGTLVGAGVGSVLAWAHGNVYLAGPYNSAPLSIVAVVSAKVGPFDLGTVVVREGLRIDPLTAAVAVVASSSDAIPHIIDGIVVHVRDIRVYIDRPRFVINPTNCDRMSFNATVNGSGSDFASSQDDVSVGVIDQFESADCRALNFNPGFRVRTSGKASRRDGASLNVKLSYPSMAQGSQANIRSVKVALPKQLPSRLSTLQKACPDEIFSANPASCPQASRVGNAVARTPILPVPLVGPAYFVSHGGAKFPELIIVLQGYGLTVELHGETFISKKGITTSTFHAIPDQPVSSFELSLPRGPNSALAANRDLCRSKPVMPAVFVAQNGLMIHRTIHITVTDCKAKHSRSAGGERRHG
jgi:uncharacterized repeat protein (TIGR01451 family)